MRVSCVLPHAMGMYKQSAAGAISHSGVSAGSESLYGVGFFPERTAKVGGINPPKMIAIKVRFLILVLDS